MATWSELGERAPEIASVGQGLLERHGIAYLATVRADGAPRVHPVCPFVVDGRLIVATPQASPKARDQIRDGRYAMHMLPGDDDAEFRISGRACAVGDGPQRERIFGEGPQFLHDDDYIFEYDIAAAASAHWVRVGQPDTYAVRRSWKEADETR